MNSHESLLTPSVRHKYPSLPPNQNCYHLFIWFILSCFFCCCSVNHTLCYFQKKVPSHLWNFDEILWAKTGLFSIVIWAAMYKALLTKQFSVGQCGEFAWSKWTWAKSAWRWWNLFTLVWNRLKFLLKWMCEILQSNNKCDHAPLVCYFWELWQIQM